MVNDKWLIISDMKEDVLKAKSFKFAVRVVNLYKYMIEEKKEFVLSKQLLRSGTSVGAMVREAEHSESKADFIHKLAIAQKEINRSIWQHYSLLQIR
jgi:four helix bundle protein